MSNAKLETTTETVMDWLHRLNVPSYRMNGQDIDRGAGIRLTLSNNDAGRVRVPVTPDAELAPDHAPGDGASENRSSAAKPSGTDSSGTNPSGAPSSGARPTERTLPVTPEEAPVVWYRRWQHQRDYQNCVLFDDEHKQDDTNNAVLGIHSIMNKELRTLSHFLFDTYAESDWLGSPYGSAPNKLRVLRTARAQGFSIPGTMVTDNRADVLSMFDEHDAVITKAISDTFPLFHNSQVFAPMTSLITEAEAHDLPETFFPSLFQGAVSKDYEIRTFYLAGDTYSMAVFSQTDEKTSVDFRRYNFEHPNRMVPYRLEKDVQDRLDRLMNALDLNTGSIDLIRTTDGDNVFLEVNPVGQFGMVSKPCNYRLEARVADHLAEMHQTATA